MINNLPTYANEYKYIVARRVDGELWFWGAWNDRNKANEVAIEIGGEVSLMSDHQIKKELTN